MLFNFGNYKKEVENVLHRLKNMENKAREYFEDSKTKTAKKSVSANCFATMFLFLIVQIWEVDNVQFKKHLKIQSARPIAEGQ